MLLRDASRDIADSYSRVLDGDAASSTQEALVPEVSVPEVSAPGAPVPEASVPQRQSFRPW